jgi:AcrR family transcriptional regulator
MRGDISGRLAAAERQRFEAAIVDETTPGYVAVRALIALGDETNERLARSTAMGREFVAGMRQRVAEGQGRAVLTERPTTAERVLETATAQIVAAGRCELAIGSVSAALGIPRRTLYHLYSASELIDACQRRALTMWRAGFVQRIQRAKADDVERLFLVVDAIAAWIGSERFHGDQVLRPALSAEPRGDELREHMNAVVRFAIGLAQQAQVAEPGAFGIFVATNVEGAAAWIDHREEAHALAIAFVEGLTGARRRT